LSIKKAQYGVIMGQYLICFVTIDDLAKAKEISRTLVQRELVACVNIVCQVSSIYRWKGKICEEEEKLMIMKTRRSLFPAVSAAVREMHPYELPEIIALELKEGLPEYLKWIDESTQINP
jgi:periplasmic divalent cation tolerance protein